MKTLDDAVTYTLIRNENTDEESEYSTFTAARRAYYEAIKEDGVAEQDLALFASVPIHLDRLQRTICKDTFEVRSGSAILYYGYHAKSAADWVRHASEQGFPHTCTREITFSVTESVTLDELTTIAGEEKPLP